MSSNISGKDRDPSSLGFPNLDKGSKISSEKSTSSALTGKLSSSRKVAVASKSTAANKNEKVAATRLNQLQQEEQQALLQKMTKELNTIVDTAENEKKRPFKGDLQLGNISTEEIKSIQSKVDDLKKETNKEVLKSKIALLEKEIELGFKSVRNEHTVSMFNDSNKLKYQNEVLSENDIKILENKISDTKKQLDLLDKDKDVYDRMKFEKNHNQLVHYYDQQMKKIAETPQSKENALIDIKVQLDGFKKRLSG